jgi:hypothetical protein
MINVTTASTKDLLSFFNANTGGNPLVKFQNRASAEKRVRALIAEMEAEERGDDKAAADACKRGDDVIPQDDAVALGKMLAVTEPKDRVATVLAYQAARLVRVAEEAKIAKALSKAAKKVPSAKAAATTGERPYQTAKTVVADCLAKGITSRKEIIAAGLAAGIKYNTIDGAHYSMCVRKA